MTFLPVRLLDTKNEIVKFVIHLRLHGTEVVD